MEITLAILASNDQKYTWNKSAGQGLNHQYRLYYIRFFNIFYKHITHQM